MKIEIIGKKYNVSDRLQSIITRKIDKFDKYFDDNTVATVVCKENNKGVYTMELTIKFADSYIIRSEVSSENMYSNIDIVLPKIERQIRRYKTRLENKLRDEAFSNDSIYGYDEVAAESVVVREKSFELNEMTLEDAITELDLIGHDFYAFMNSEKGRVNIVYHRKNGEIGLLDLVY